MMSFDEGEDNFFDAYEEIRSSIDSDNSLSAHQEFELLGLEYELWLREPMSVQYRRKRFLIGMGFDEFAATSLCSMSNKELAIVSPEEQPDRERKMQNSGAVLKSLASPNVGQSEDSFCYIRDLDNGRKFIVHELGKDGLPCVLKEVGSDKLMTLQDFEILLGLSKSVQKFLRREVASYGKNTTCSGDAKKNKILSWCRSFSKTKQRVRVNKYDVSLKKSKITRMMKTKVLQYRKNCSEFSALYMTQEIQAHKGMIRTMKFCPTGRYLASGGEDCILRIWQIIQTDSSCRWNTYEGSSRLVKEVKAVNLILRRDSNFAPVLIPEEILFKIEENPSQELHGHTSDILDISWSKFNCLLTSSKDKTVRLWKIGCHGCLKIFRHNDYVTCIQFNPIDDRFFISGSIDGKVRVWEIPENRVIDWVDVRDMVTAVCYQPDGKGFVVGSIRGSCRFYDCSAKMSQLASKLSLFSKKKSSGKRITGLQFCPGDSKRVMITSADSRIRISDGVDVILKFKGLRKAKCQLCASFTADGRHIVSMGEDSNVYLWSFDKSRDLRYGGGKSVRSSEFFLSKAAAIVAPWPGRINQGALASDSIQISSQPNREPVSWLMNPDCFSLGMRLFSDGSSRMTATWPEEKLSLQTMQQLHPEDRNTEQHNSPLHRDFWSLALTTGAWSSVTVTAGNDGIIRSFQNYGFPVGL